MFYVAVYSQSNTQHIQLAHLLQNTASCDMYIEEEKGLRRKDSGIVKLGNQLSTNSGSSLGTTQRPGGEAPWV